MWIDVLREFLTELQPRPGGMADREVVRQTTSELKELNSVVTMLLGSLEELKDSLTEAIALGEKAEQVPWKP